VVASGQWNIKGKEAVVRALRDALTKAEHSLASSDGEASLTGSFTVTVRGKGQ
jgi:hypothetical protein